MAAGHSASQTEALAVALSPQLAAGFTFPYRRLALADARLYDEIALNDP